jgi:BlaI family transcriptional regulator, penicillinase repressor
MSNGVEGSAPVAPTLKVNIFTFSLTPPPGKVKNITFRKGCPRTIARGVFRTERPSDVHALHAAKGTVPFSLTRKLGQSPKSSGKGDSPIFVDTKIGTVPKSSHSRENDMSKSAEVQLSRRERQIMDVIYARGEASATDVLAAMRNPPTRTTVRTMLRILEAKGHLIHTKRSREFIYRPTQSRVRAGESAFRRVVQTFFDGSLEQAVAVHFSDPETNLSDDELKRLADLIRQARKKGV